MVSRLVNYHKRRRKINESYYDRLNDSLSSSSVRNVSQKQYFEIGHNLEVKPIEKNNFSQKTKTEKPKQNFKQHFLIAKSLNIGYYLITPLLLGVFFGLLIDNFLKTKPFFTIILIIFGVVASFYNLWKVAKENDASH